jgi:hypothetical protein
MSAPHADLEVDGNEFRELGDFGGEIVLDDPPEDAHANWEPDEDLHLNL